MITMFPIETLVTFFGAAVLLALVPGPDNIFVLTQSALHGKISGILITLGLCTGLLVHTSAVAFGVAVLFQTSSMAFIVLKFLGTGYLLYLAWQTFRAPTGKMTPVNGLAKNYSRLYGRGIIMNVTNPKVSIFFLAFLPQFTDPSKGQLTLQITLLGGLFILATILVFGGIALLAGTTGQWLRRSEQAQRILNRGAAVVLAGLACTLATASR